MLQHPNSRSCLTFSGHLLYLTGQVAPLRQHGGSRRGQRGTCPRWAKHLAGEFAVRLYKRAVREVLSTLTLPSGSKNQCRPARSRPLNWPSRKCRPISELNLDPLEHHSPSFLRPRGRSGFVRCRAKPLGGGASGDHTSKCGVSFEHPHGLGRHGSFDPVCHGRSQDRRSRRTLTAACRRPAEVEPNLNSDTTADGDCGCVNCPACCTANALQGGRSDCPALASLDADLQRVVGAWDGLPTHIRKTILALVGFVEPPANANVPPNGAGAGTPARRSSALIPKLKTRRKEIA